LVFGLWSLVFGFWFLVLDFWFLVFWLLVFGCAARCAEKLRFSVGGLSRFCGSAAGVVAVATNFAVALQTTVSL
jgi:hypothetical protein